MNRILCFTFAMSVLASPALAGMSEGVAAVTVGDYPRAISEFEPLANSGDAVAQYQLGKLYLEGHGPADGVARGVELMTKAAHGNHPEAQAQLGLMYAMGLGVPVDNAKAYEWLTKAVDQLPDGTRRTVAAANRDAVQKRMGLSQVTNVAATPKATVETPPAPVKPAATEAQAAATTATTPAKPAPTKVEPSAAATTPTAKPTMAKAETQPATTTAKVEAKPAEKPAASATSTTKPVAKVETAKVEATPAATGAAAKPATTTTTAPTAKVTEAANTKPAKTPDTSTQVASAKAPEPESAAPKASDTAKQAAQSGFRIQIASVPSEDLAWSEWKRLSGKFGPQLEGLKAIVQSADLGEQGIFYRLQTGPFETMEAAEQRCAAMSAAGLSCLVVGSR